jgi:hypothetical protein
MLADVLAGVSPVGVALPGSTVVISAAAQMESPARSDRERGMIAIERLRVRVRQLRNAPSFERPSPLRFSM